jgi:preprotein translocase subunit SecA
MEGYDLFDELLRSIEERISIFLLKAEVRQNTEREDKRNNKIVHDTHIKQKGTPIKKEKKIGRNDPCPCGSGLKYKNCCGK